MAGHATLPDAALEKKPSERDLDRVSKKMGDSWWCLLTHLGIQDTEYKSLLEKYGCPIEACFFGLVSWLQVQPSQMATWNTLLEAVERAGHKEYANTLRHNIIYNDITTNPTLIQQPIEEWSISQVKPSEIDLDIISKKVTAGQWRSLLTHLGVNAAEITRFREEFFRPLDACFFALIHWLEGNTSCKPVRAVLYEALEEAGRRDCISCPRGQMQESSRECPPIFNEKPSLAELNHIKNVINGNWRSFLTHLGVSATKVKSLYEMYQRNPEEVCYAGMVYWRDSNEASKPSTWNVLLEALQDGARRTDFAREKRNELHAINVACLDILADRIYSYLQAVNNLIQHRDKGIAYFCEAADNIDRVYKRVAAARITGSGLGIGGGILGIVGGGLLLGGVTAPAGIPLLAFGTVVGVSGAITGVGATIGNVVANRKTESRANKWLRTGSDLCVDVIMKRKLYHDELEKICQLYGESGEDAVIGRSITRKDLDIDLSKFQDADDKIRSIIDEWTKALEIGAEGIATAFVSGTRVGGELVRGAFGHGGVITRVASQGGVIPRVAGQGGVVTRIAGQGGAVARGVAVGGAETGAAVARVAVQAAGGVVIGLSAAFIVVDLALIGKVAYDMNKNKEGTKLGKWLREAAAEIKLETDTLRCFACCGAD